MKWFLSYAYSRIPGFSDEIHFGSSVVDGSEHPVARVARWNLEIDRVHVLLNYHELPDDFPHELDVEI